MSVKTNDIWEETVHESLVETVDRIEGDLRKAWNIIDHMQPLVEAAAGYIDSVQAAHHGPFNRQRKDALHRLFEEVENYVEWENDS